MAWTQADVDTIKAAIGLGAREVRYADGRLVTYRSIAEMIETLQLMQNDIAGTTGRSLSADRVASGYVGNLSRGAPVFGPGRDGGGCW